MCSAEPLVRLAQTCFHNGLGIQACGGECCSIMHTRIVNQVNHGLPCSCVTVRHFAWLISLPSWVSRVGANLHNSNAKSVGNGLELKFALRPVFVLFQFRKATLKVMLNISFPHVQSQAQMGA